MKFVVWRTFHLESPWIVDDYLDRIRPCLEGHEFVVCEDEECAKREIVDADVMIGWRITPAVFERAKKLKWIQFGSAGIDHTLFPELIESGVILTNLSGIHTAVVAEHVIGLMLALSRRLDLSMRLQIERRYDRSEIASTAQELAGKTVGIVGLGRIGQSIARLAMAFGMAAIGTKRTSDPSLMADEIYTPQDLRLMLAKSDFLVLVVPLTPDTRALIGREEIALMPDGSYLVNVARGAMVDHEALKEALHSGKLRGAALDVFPEEPLRQDSPLYDLPNLIITPHTAGSSPNYGKRAADIFRANLNAFLSGGEMINVYDRERGY